MRTCLSQRISCIPLQKRTGNIRRACCRAPIPVSWMWNAQPCTNSSFVCWLLCCPLPAYRRKSKATKDTPSDRSSTKSTLYQEECGTIPINTFWIQKKKKKNTFWIQKRKKRGRERETNLKSYHWKQELSKRPSGFFILQTKLKILGDKFSASSNMVV